MRARKLQQHIFGSKPNMSFQLEMHKNEDVVSDEAMSGNLPAFIIRENYFPYFLTVKLYDLELNSQNLQYLRDKIEENGLSEYIKLGLQTDEEGLNFVVVRYSMRTAAGARTAFGVGYSTPGIYSSLRTRGVNISKVFDMLCAPVFFVRANAFFDYDYEAPEFSEFYNKLGEKRASFASEVESFYNETPSVNQAKSSSRLVFGKGDNDFISDSLLVNLLGHFAENKMPIFLGFLRWEIFEPLLQKYYKENVGGEEFIRVENLLKRFLEQYEFEHECSKFFALIKAARRKNVRVYAADSELSHFDEDISNKYTNYIAKQIIDNISPDRYVYLYNNESLLDSGSRFFEGQEIIKYPSLLEILGYPTYIACYDLEEGFCGGLDVLRELENRADIELEYIDGIEPAAEIIWQEIKGLFVVNPTVDSSCEELTVCQHSGGDMSLGQRELVARCTILPNDSTAASNIEESFQAEVVTDGCGCFFWSRW